MTPFPETGTVNFDIIDWKIASFLEGSIDPFARLDSAYPKTIPSKLKLYERFGKEKIGDFEVVETYVTEHGKTQNQVIALDKDNGVYAIQLRSNTNGKGYEKKTWGATRLCRLGEEVNRAYLKSLVKDAKK